MTFAGAALGSAHLNVSLILPQWVDHPRFNRIDLFGPVSYGQRLRLTAPEQVDAELGGWLREAYRAGSRRT